MMRRLRGMRAVIPAAALAAGLAFGLSGCGASSDQVSAAMHGSVVQIAERAAAGDYPGALAELALLDRDVTSAVENGSIDATREAEIRAAMDLVRADLEAADVASTPTPTPTPTPDPATVPADDNVDNGGDDAPGNNDNKGKGNNNGNDDKGKNDD